jgi:hypothetical protein
LLKKAVKVADSLTLNIIPGPDPTAGCDLRCDARVVGVADLPDDGDNDSFHQQVALLRLMVERPDGEHEVCVRQDIPPEFRAVFVPGGRVPVKTHPLQRGRAFVMWGNGPNGASLVQHRLLKWPEPDRWPEPGRIEVFYKNERRDERFAGWRAERTPVLAQLAGGQPTSMMMNGRTVYRLGVHTPQGPLTLKSQVPQLALARLMFMFSAWRVGAPIVLLVGRNGKDQDIDWEATIARPENWLGGQG